jgi:dephospho-CoA kinase
MVAVANALRHEHGPSYLVDELFKRALAAKKPAVIESIRCPGEVDSLRGKGEFMLLAIDADSKTRYERIIKRGTSTDAVSYEEFLEQEEQEMQNTDPFMQNIRWCMDHADVTLENNGSLKELDDKLKSAVEEYL